jgi:hypothetical protein
VNNIPASYGFIGRASEVRTLLQNQQLSLKIRMEAKKAKRTKKAGFQAVFALFAPFAFFASTLSFIVNLDFGNVS